MTISKLSGYYCILEASQTYLSTRYAGRTDELCLEEPTAPHLELGLGWGRQASQAEAFLAITKAQLRNITHPKTKEYNVNTLAGSTSGAAAYTCLKAS